MVVKTKLSGCVTALALCIVLSLGGAGTVCAYGQELGSGGLVLNSGFEDGKSKWSFSGDNVLVANKEARTGKASLRITSDRSSITPWAAQKMNATPGRVCQVSGWVKTDSLNGNGAFLRLAWSDQNNVALSYCESRPVTAAADWTRVEFSVRVPRNASFMKLTLFLKGSTGTAWFDDIQVVPDDSTDLRGRIRYPTYRQTILPGQDKHVTVGYEAMGSSTHPLEQLELNVTLYDAQNRQLAQLTSQKLLAGGWSSVGFNLWKYGAGSYRVSADLVDKSTRKVLNTDSRVFSIAEDNTPVLQTYVDEHNRYVVDGKPFFPVGLYTSKSNADDLTRISEAGFNCVMDYAVLARPLGSMSSFLDLHNDKGLKLIFSLKDCYDSLDGSNSVTKYGDWQGSFEVIKGLVSTFKSHPAILAWYLNDEKSGPYLPQITERYKWIRNGDPDHPVWQTIWSAQDVRAHIESSDIMAMDVYPVWQMYKDKSAYPHLETFGSETKRVWQDAMGSGCIGMVPECSSFRQLTPESRPPTYQDMLCLSYEALIGGARGLIFYSYARLESSDGDSQWTAVRRLGQTLDWLKPIALGVDASPGERVRASDSHIDTLTRVADGQIYVLAANPYNEAFTSEFDLGALAGVKQVEAITPTGTVEVLSVSKNCFADTIECRGTRTYRLCR